MAPDWNEVAFMRVMRVNLLGPINLVRAILPGMIQRRRGRIALCGSIAGWTGGVLAAPHYSASKGGVHALIRWFAQRATPHGVQRQRRCTWSDRHRHDAGCRLPSELTR